MLLTLNTFAIQTHRSMNQQFVAFGCSINKTHCRDLVRFLYPNTIERASGLFPGLGLLQTFTYRFTCKLVSVFISLWSPALQADSLPAESQGKPKYTGVGSLSLLQRSSQPRNRIGVSCVAGGFFTNELSGKPHFILANTFV